MLPAARHLGAVHPGLHALAAVTLIFGWLWLGLRELLRPPVPKAGALFVRGRCLKLAGDAQRWRGWPRQEAKEAEELVNSRRPPDRIGSGNIPRTTLSSGVLAELGSTQFATIALGHRTASSAASPAPLARHRAGDGLAFGAGK